MAPTLTVPGPCLIAVQPDAVMFPLGYTIDGVNTDDEPFFTDIQGDENGGTDGPPIDVQHFGSISRIRLELNKFDQALFNSLEARVNNGTSGVIPIVGSLMFQGDLTWQLHLLPVHDVTKGRNYPVAFPRTAISKNISAKVQRASCDFEAHMNPVDRKLYEYPTVSWQSVTNEMASDILNGTVDPAGYATP